jgi:hypothetical protein
MAMIRKQLYLGEAQQRKLRRLAARWGCAEAEVVRKAIDRLPEPEATLDDLVAARLAAAAFLVPPPDDDDILSEAEAEELEREITAWDKQHGPLGLSEAVARDRDGR